MPEANIFQYLYHTRRVVLEFSKKDLTHPAVNFLTQRKLQTDLSLVRNHIVSGLIRSADFTDEELLSTLTNSSIRITIFTPRHVVTAECAGIISLNTQAKNGVDDRVISRVTMNLKAKLWTYGRFGTLLQLLSDAGPMDLLRDLKGISGF